MKIAVITVSDRASKGEYEDLSGPEIVKIIKDAFPETVFKILVVPDEPDLLRKALQSCLDCHWIITTGGTGISPRDITPEVTGEFCDLLLPGIAETLRAESLKETPQAMLSRGTAGLKDNTLIVNFPGSRKGAAFCAKVLLPILEHGIAMRLGAGHSHGNR